jgi:CDP-glycerol glycerophosphotransferase (TagB/SpsB family)
MRAATSIARLARIPRQVGTRYQQASNAFRAARALTSSPEARYFTECYRTRRLEPDVVLYQAHTGAGMVCNPYAIFRALLSDPEFAGLTHIWVLDTDQEIQLRSREYAGHANVKFVRFKSPAYLKALATAGYLIQNTSFPSFFVKRPGQVYVNTWHSAGAVKRMGFDMPEGNYGSRNVLRNLLMADYIVSPNPLMTRVFTESYRLRGLYPGKILEFGYPRNDVTLHTPRQDVIAELQARGVQVDPDKKIILYAPTWRGTISNIRGGAEPLERVRDGILAGVDEAEYQVLIKPHQYHYSRLTTAQKRSGRYIPRQVNANRLLAAVDVLVSDYSSIFFDFMVTGKPVLFYLPDSDEYATERGVYFSWDELPGPTTGSVPELASWLADIEGVAARYADRYERMRAVTCAQEDGSASRRAVDVIFRGREVPGVIDDCVDPGKKRILIHVRDLEPDGVSVPLLGLLPRIDPSRYDVTVAGIGSGPRSRENVEKLRDVRVLARTGTPTLTLQEAVGLEYLARYGRTGMTRLLDPDRALAREYRRCFGESRFDVIIDYSARPGIFPWVALQADGAKQVVWQHTDLQADLRNRRKEQESGSEAAPATKAALRSTYEAVDAVVSTSRPLMEVNREQLATPRTRKRFRHAESVIDTGRVRDLLAESDLWPARDGRITADVALLDDGTSRTLELPHDAPAPDSGEPYLAFATMGRLVPEKNLENLVLAFSDFVAEHPNSRLFLIGGGPAEDDLRRLAAWPELRRRVCFTGHLRNPFAVLRHSDCFVLPSLSEGFNLSVPEARLLGLPIILGDFATASVSSLPGGQYPVGRSREDILEGLRAFAEGRVPTGYEFDVEAHNRQATAQFEALLDSL